MNNTVIKARLFHEWTETLPKETVDQIDKWVDNICLKTGLYQVEAQALLAELFCFVRKNDVS